MSRKNPRLVKVKTILPTEEVKQILLLHSISTKRIEDKISSLSSMVDENREVHDSDSNLIITKINRLESLIEKILYISLISILISCLTLCIC